ncbi:ELM1/GtrOC1 family putative glycosyltransferase [Acinetobacter pragensis]|uniref:Nucleoside-diphosphate sugar epimerase n=1 Tax=Acinetobacter pragensis TaxID=1806892 RepID=A0A151XZ82_9GAMM|nr:ELM1/GtrOC1 family putative glycosyltransferase [Acinetobacter pragensis]KYQ71096.1 hypothetical protein AZH43_02885 [Acinetobacter pragensis]
MNQNILVIHDGRNGHHNPSLAIAEILQTQYAFSIQNYKQNSMTSKRLTSLLKKASHFPWLFKLLSPLLFKSIPPNLKNTKVIVCSGMPNLIYAAYLSQRFNIPLIYAGNVRNFNAHFIDWSISAMHQECSCKQIILPTPPVLQKFSQLQNLPFSEHAVLMLGGSTTEYPFQDKDFELMIMNFIQFTQGRHLTGTIICSRRTPNLSQQSLDLMQQHAVEFKAFSKDIPIMDSLTKSHYIFVTEDSVTMLAEAIHTGRVVTSICFNEQVISSLIGKYLDQHLIQRKTAAQIKSTANIFSQIEKQDMNNRIIHEVDLASPPSQKAEYALLAKH